VDSLPYCCIIDETAACSSFYIVNHNQCFVFTTATAENSVLNKYVVKPLLLYLINLDSYFSQTAKMEEVYLHQMCLSRNSHRICLRVTFVHMSLAWRHC